MRKWWQFWKPRLVKQEPWQEEWTRTQQVIQPWHGTWADAHSLSLADKEMYNLALAMNGGKAQGALTLIRTGAFQKAWAERSAEKAHVAFGEYLGTLADSDGGK